MTHKQQLDYLKSKLRFYIHTWRENYKIVDDNDSWEEWEIENPVAIMVSSLLLCANIVWTIGNSIWIIW